MKLGIIARADMGRGLAHQTYSFYKNLDPAVTVVVDNTPFDRRADPTNPDAPWPLRLDLYPDAIVSPWAGYTGRLSDEAMQALTECDVTYTAETHYDERLQDHRSVLHVNPEFWREQRATMYWYPTRWLIEGKPEGHLVPTPVDDEDIAAFPPGKGDILHVAGHQTIGDRNGTAVVLGLTRTQHRKPWRIATQDGMKIHPRTMTTITLQTRVRDRWAMYEGCGVLAYPRRYGGQSLQVNEAMARGLAVVMGDNPPNLDTWPVVPVPARDQGFVRTPAGNLQMWVVNPTEFMATITALDDPELLDAWQVRSLLWARDNAWSVWKPKILELLADAAS